MQWPSVSFTEGGWSTSGGSQSKTVLSDTDARKDIVLVGTGQTVLNVVQPSESCNTSFYKGYADRVFGRTPINMT